MTNTSPEFVLSTSPYVKRAADTPVVMRHVLYSLIPAWCAAVYVFGASVVLVLLACAAGALVTEWLATGRANLKSSALTDGSALVTAVLLAMTLPPTIPLWMAFLGGVVAVVLGKALFGGLGQNIFNPSLTGRAFLQAAFPEAMTTWQSPRTPGAALWDFPASTFTLPFMTPDYDGVSGATPLGLMKFESIPTPWFEMFTGTIGGSIGETSALLLAIGGLYLAVRRFLNWRIPVAMLSTVLLVAAVSHYVAPDQISGGLHHLFAGGVVLGALYMATDPVTSPVTPRGCWVFGFGAGVLVVIIREFGGLPEGVMYSILLMNALVPHIDQWTQPRIYGATARPMKEN